MWFRSLLIVSVGVLFLLDVSEATAQWSYEKLNDDSGNTISHNALTMGSNGDLLVACYDDEFSVVVMEANLSYGFQEYVWVNHRFDSAKGQEGRWKTGMINGGATLSGSKAIQFSDLLMAHNNVIIKIGDGNTMKFSLKGSRVTIKKVIAACQP